MHLVNKTDKPITHTLQKYISETNNNLEHKLLKEITFLPKQSKIMLQSITAIHRAYCLVLGIKIYMMKYAV